MGKYNIIEVKAGNIDKYGLFCSKNPRSEGYLQKKKWLQERFHEGLKMLIARSEDGKDLGFIEYIPGEFAWRPVDAKGYLFIHCIYVGRKADRKLGLGSRLVEMCVEDASRQGALGVAVACSEGAWLAGKDLFLRNGFEVTDQKDRFDLLVRKIKNGPLPKFNDWQAQLPKYKGWHLILAHQCPWHEKAAQVLFNFATENGIDLAIKEIKTPEEAQKAPTGFGVFNLIHDGQVLADHYISRTRFSNILKEEFSY